MNIKQVSYCCPFLTKTFFSFLKTISSILFSPIAQFYSFWTKHFLSLLYFFNYFFHLFKPLPRLLHFKTSTAEKFKTRGFVSNEVSTRSEEEVGPILDDLDHRKSSVRASKGTRIRRKYRESAPYRPRRFSHLQLVPQKVHLQWRPPQHLRNPYCSLRAGSLGQGALHGMHRSEESTRPFFLYCENIPPSSLSSWIPLMKYAELIPTTAMKRMMTARFLMFY